MNLKTITVGMALGLGTLAGAGTFEATHESAIERGQSLGTLTLTYQSIAGNARVMVNGQRLQAGHIVYQRGSGEFRTFCIELAQHVGTGQVTYDITELTGAPNPGPALTQTQADGVSAVLANAYALGWIGANLQADTTQTDYVSRMAAIQAAIWAAVGGDVDIDSSETTASVRDAYYVLTDSNTWDDSLRLSNLLALSHRSRQDMVYVVPLPPAAMAGAGLLCVGLGVRRLRRRA